MEKDPKKPADPAIQDLKDDKIRADADRKALKVDSGRVDGRNVGSLEAEARQAVQRGNAVRAVFRGQYPALGPLREPGDIFQLEDESHFSELWMTRDLDGDLVEIQAHITKFKQDKERHETLRWQAERSGKKFDQPAPVLEATKKSGRKAPKATPTHQVEEDEI